MGVKGKGQVTLFMAIGIVLIGIAVTVIILTTQNQEPITDSPTQELSALQTYLQACLQQAAQKSFQRAGLQGGYAQLPEHIGKNPSLHLSPFPNANIKIPYWVKSQQSYAPSLQDIEQTVAVDMIGDVEVCLQQIDQNQQNQFEVDSLEEPTISLQILDSSVIAVLNYTVTATGLTSQAQQDTFTAVLPFSIQEPLLAAQTLANMHGQSTYLSNAALDLMVLDEDNIPISGFDIRCQQKTWLQRNVEVSLKNLLFRNFARIRIQNTNHLPFQNDIRDYAQFADISIDNYEQRRATDRLPNNAPSDLYDFLHYYWDIGLEDRFAGNINIRYLEEFPLEMSVNPSDAGLLSTSLGQQTGEYLNFFCIHAYKFTYDVQFPVEIVVTQPNGLGPGTPFVLRYVLPVTIQNNIPQTEEVVLEPSLGFAAAQLCEPTFDDPVSIFVSDAYSQADLSNVDIFYECAGVSCYLGTTSSSDNGGAVRLQAEVPQSCFGGEFVARPAEDGPSMRTVRRQWDNLADTLYLDTDLLTNRPLLISTNSAEGSLRSLDGDQTVYVTLRHQNGFQSNQYITTQDQAIATLELLQRPTSYNISAILFTDGFIAGGFEGTLDVTQENLRQQLVLRVYQDITYPTDPQQAAEYFQQLQDPAFYEGLYYPEWR